MEVRQQRVAGVLMKLEPGTRAVPVVAIHAVYELNAHAVAQRAGK